MQISHFRKISPAKIMAAAYLYVCLCACILYDTDFYNNNPFFQWGPPIQFFGKKIDTNTSFYLLHFLIFFHQIINNCVNTVVYPWILNSVQDPKNKNMEYNTFSSLLLINLFDIYSELDMVFIIGGFMSQISFVITIILANMITSTFINKKYLDLKSNVDEFMPFSEDS